MGVEKQDDFFAQHNEYRNELFAHMLKRNQAILKKQLAEEELRKRMFEPMTEDGYQQIPESVKQEVREAAKDLKLCP